MTQQRLSSTPWPDHLITLLERQHALAKALTELAVGQAALIETGRNDELLTLLGRRQAIVDQFIASQDDLARCSIDLEQRLGQLAPPARQRITQLLATIGQTLAEVMDRDGRDQQSLQANCELARRDLASLGAARAATSAYRTGRAAVNRFADRQG